MAAKTGGCFPGNASVLMADGRRKNVSELQAGDRVQTVDSGGRLTFSRFLTFLDREPEAVKLFHAIETRDPPRRLLLTAAHLVFVADNHTLDLGRFRPAFASEVRPGQYVYTAGGGGGNGSNGNDHRGPARVTAVTVGAGVGAYAPLTQHGTLAVDGVLASCYAAVDAHDLAHWAFAPLRLCYRVSAILGSKAPPPPKAHYPHGVHWYSRLLHRLGKLLLSPGRFHPWGVAQG